MSRSEVGLYPINGRHYPGNSSIVDYGLGLNESIMRYSLEEAARGIVREFKRQGKILSQQQAIEIGHQARSAILKSAADKGTQLHTHAYNLINKKSEYNAENDDPYYQGLFLWLKQHDVQPVLMEKLLWDEIEGYAGRLDFFGYVDGRLRLMDFKSNRTIQPKMGLQLAGYKHLLESWGYIEKDAPLEMVILHLTPGIAYEIPFFETWETYKALKKMFWWKFYRYKPDTYLRSPEGAVEDELAQTKQNPGLSEIFRLSAESHQKKEARSSEELKTSQEQQFAQDSNIQGRQFRQAEWDSSPNISETEDETTPPFVNTYPGQEDKQLRETAVELSQLVPLTEKRRRGRPRKDQAANTSLHTEETQPQTPDEMELDPKHLHPPRLNREFLERAA
jgi:hypothetical protein